MWRLRTGVGQPVGWYSFVRLPTNLYRIFTFPLTRVESFPEAVVNCLVTGWIVLAQTRPINSTFLESEIGILLVIQGAHKEGRPVPEVPGILRTQIHAGKYLSENEIHRLADDSDLVIRVKMQAV